MGQVLNLSIKNDSTYLYYRWYVKTKNAPVRGGEKVDWFTGQGE